MAKHTQKPDQKMIVFIEKLKSNTKNRHLKRCRFFGSPCRSPAKDGDPTGNRTRITSLKSSRPNH